MTEMTNASVARNPPFTIFVGSAMVLTLLCCTEYRDITLRVFAEGLDPQTTIVNDAMTGEVFACMEDDDIETAARLMGDQRVRRLLVMKDGRKLSGMLSIGDLAKSGDKELVGEVLSKISSPAQH
jgi:signal-transduction protein with cAMP-binding, CBS, and nucleotidyltransferase domain